MTSKPVREDDTEQIGIYRFDGEVVRAVEVGPDLRNIGVIMGWLPLGEFEIKVADNAIDLIARGSRVTETLRPGDWLFRAGLEAWGTVDEFTFAEVFERWSR